MQTPTLHHAGPEQNHHAPAASELHVGQDLMDYIKHYASEKPEVAALWCFGIGFVLGWKLKPW